MHFSIKITMKISNITLTSPTEAMRSFALQYDIDINKRLTLQQHEFLFHQLIEDYLKKKISLSIITLIDPRAAMHSYALQHGIDVNKPITFGQYEFIFLKLVDDYLRRKISLDEFYALVGKCGFDLLDNTTPNTNSQSLQEVGVKRSSETPELFTIDEIIDYIADFTYKIVYEHQPTMELVDKTILTDEDYPFDWPMLEALRYYKKHRHVLNEFRHDRRSVRTEEA